MDIETHLFARGVLPEYLYRIVPLARFLQGSRESQNTLVSPANWPDPYEAAQLRTQIESPMFVDENGVCMAGRTDDILRKVGGTIRHSTSAAKNVYCQCWSNLPESDAMWRLYSSPDSMGVKLRVSLSDLLISIFAETGYSNVFLGAVDYISQEEYDALIRDAKANHLIQMRTDIFDKVPGDRWARCMLRKRKQFEHESEYRLIMTRIFPDNKEDAPPLFQYPFDYNKLVSEIELDPRCTDVADVQRQINDSGYLGEVKKSRLYDPPNYYVRDSWPEDEGWSTGSERKWKDVS